MVDPKRLLDDLKRFVTRLEDDLRERTLVVPEMAERLAAEYQVARNAGRTGETLEAWSETVLTQAAVAWVLGCVFVRFMEDNGLVDEPMISGPGERNSRASDRQTLYFQANPTDTDRDYLYDVFRNVLRLPAVAKLYDEAHNPLWAYGISGDAAKDLIAFWRKIVPETGALVHDFTDSEWNTRFLGDLYQDLSESARKRYALLQTPEFVEEFILDRTLDPAIEEFGLKDIRLIDPTCGSGHFLLGTFQRLLDRWMRKEPGTPERALAQRALDGVYGVDINPFAVAIARFRLLVAALKASGIRRLKEAPGYRINVTAGDSLLHGRRFGELDLGSGAEHLLGRPGIGHAFNAEDLDEVNRILGQQYHAVVGNPPYITVKDKALNQLYRDRYVTCHRQYSLGVPFTERFFGLAVPGTNTEASGFIGLVTANSFMKREFGKKLIEEYLPLVDLTHVIDTSGTYIPGHGTPTVIMFGRHRPPIEISLRTVMGIKGEPSTPIDAAQGLVWTAIVDQLDQAGSESDWVGVADTGRDVFAKHPWSIGGGGAAELGQAILDNTSTVLAKLVSSIGFYQDTHADEVFVQPNDFVLRRKLQTGFALQVRGDDVRDWVTDSEESILFPYQSGSLSQWKEIPRECNWSWLHALRTTLWSRSTFGGGTYKSDGRPWFDYHQFPKHRAASRRAIAFAFVATHNHFVLDRGGKVFNRSAPVIKLPADASEEDHLALLGLLNSSVACFWMKQVFHNKGSTVDTKGARQTTDAFENFYEFTGTGLKKFPVSKEKPLDVSQALDRLAQDRQTHMPDHLSDQLPLPRETLDSHKSDAANLLRRMIGLQEELDWRCYRLYGVADQDLCYRNGDGAQTDPPEIELGQRAFEIVMARRMAKGDLETTWFDRHRSTPVTDIPDHWPDDYRELVQRRIAAIESDPDIGLIERPEYKRRWNQEAWEDREQRALKGWLLDRLEIESYWAETQLLSTRAIADHAQTDADFMAVAELYVGHQGFDVATLVARLVEDESVPQLAILRYKPAGLRKRAEWENTWVLQRHEDAIDAQVVAELVREPDETDDELETRLNTEQRTRKQVVVGDIPPPSKYRSADFLNTTTWRLRGSLDVPKERFVSYPHCARENDPSLVVAWAGWDHLQQAQALAGYYTEMVEQEGWSTERLKPLLAGLSELLPWLKQWHSEINPDFNQSMSEFFETYLQSELQKHGLTTEDLHDWAPPATRRRRRGRST